MIGELRASARYLRGLGGYLRRPLAPGNAASVIERQLARRETVFLRTLERGVFARPESVYRRLFAHAGVGLGDAAELVHAHGLEGALSRLHDAGVRVELEEFKARRPIVRPGLELRVTEADFDNPLLARDYEGRTGGSRSAGRRIVVDLDLLAHESAHHWMFLASNGLTDRPLAVWHAVPPGAAGIKCVLYEAKLGRSAERWFTQVKPSGAPGSRQYDLFTRVTIAVGRLAGRPIPRPEHVPASDPGPVVKWLAAKVANGTPAVVSTNPSSAVRACLAAADGDVDIAGTAFLLGGEPVTPAKVQVVEQEGCLVVPVYAMAELGLIGIGCPSSRTIDDVHLLSDKLAVTQHERPAGPGPPVSALHFTSLLPSSPKLMINVESGDHGVLDVFPCDCAFGRAGLAPRLREIRSYEKLTSEGNAFLGGDLIGLLEETLPARFGGGPTDYQLLEEEDAGGLSKVRLIVSPRVGAVDEPAVVRLVLESLAGHSGGGLMAQVWREGETLEVVRAEPYATPTAKVQPLHRHARQARP